MEFLLTFQRSSTKEAISETSKIFSMFSVNNVRSGGLISISLMCASCVKLLLRTRESKALPYIPLAISWCGA
jgi:hypothetical protein